MSMESAGAFMERLKSDKEFAAAVNGFASLDEVLDYVKRAGFDFTIEELQSLTGRLSDDELSSVAGGWGNWGPQIYRRV